ncbi:unnamed protein product [Caretta caretta]
MRRRRSSEQERATCAGDPAWESEARCGSRVEPAGSTGALVTNPLCPLPFLTLVEVAAVHGSKGGAMREWNYYVVHKHRLEDLLKVKELSMSA